MNLITGGTGFIGPYLINSLLKAGEKVKILSRKTSNIDFLKGKNIELVFGDLSDPYSLERATKGVDTVYHLAALVGEKNVPYEEFEKANVIGTRNLIEACIKNEVRRFIFISSTEAMGNVINGNEETPCKPITDYGKSKLEAEKIVNLYSRRIGITIVRASYVYGPGMRSTKIAKIFIDIMKKKVIILGKGDKLINFIFIDDFIKALSLIKENSMSIGQTYIISEGRPYLLREIIEIFRRETKAEKAIFIPRFLAPFFSGRVQKIADNSSFDITKARVDLGFYPSVALEEGIKKTIEWFKKLQ